MDKNKNRTDLLAAGRKRLQQFRQKKDNKGSKSSSKPGKSEYNENTSSTKRAATSQPVLKGQKSMHDFDDGVSASDSNSREDLAGANNDVTTDFDQPSVSSLNEITGEKTVELSLEDSAIGLAELNDDVSHEFPAQSSSTQDGDYFVVVEDVSLTSPEVSLMADSKEQLTVNLKSEEDRQHEIQQNAEGSGLMQVGETGSGIEEDNKLLSVESDGRSIANVETKGDMREGELIEASMDKYPEDTNLPADYSCESIERTLLGTVGENLETQGSAGFSCHLSEKAIGREIEMSTGPDVSLITLSQLGEEPVLERLKEQLYLTMLAKDAFHLQLSEQLEIQYDLTSQHHQLDDKLSTATASLVEIRGKNENLTEEAAQCRSLLQEAVVMRDELQEELNGSRAEVEKSSARVDQLLNELEISRGDLTRLSSELTECRNSLIAFQTENENLRQNLYNVSEEKDQLVLEKNSMVLENERLVSELANCKHVLVSLQVENTNMSEQFALAAEESSKINAEKQYLLSQNEKLNAELGKCENMLLSLQIGESEEKKKIEYEKEYLLNESEEVAMESIKCAVFAEALQMEIFSMKNIFAPDTDKRNKIEEEKMYFSSKNEELSRELVECKALVVNLQTDSGKAVNDLKEAALRIEHLVEEIVYLKCNLEFHKEEMKEDSLMRSLKSELPGDQGGSRSLSSDERDSSLDAEGFRKQMIEAASIMGKLEKAIEKIHSHSESLSNSSGEVVSSGVSKLIQAFETKGHNEDSGAEEQPFAGSQSTEDPYEVSKEKTQNLKEVLLKLLLHAENATRVIEDERKSTIFSEATLASFSTRYESLNEHSDCLEEANVELTIISEVLRQHICDLETKNRELEARYDALKEKEVNLIGENNKLSSKLCDFEAKVSELQSQLGQVYLRSDEMMSSLSSQVEALSEVVASREAMLEEEWNSTILQIVQTVGKLDSSITMICSTSSCNSLDVTCFIAASVDAATKVIEDLKGQLEAARKEYEVVLNTHNEDSKAIDGLKKQQDMALSRFHKVYCDLMRLVREYCGSVEGSETDALKDRPLDPDNLGEFDTLIDQVKTYLRERSILETENSELRSELMDGAKHVVELNKKCLGSDAILKLLENIEQELKLEEFASNTIEPLAHLESVLYRLIQKYKEADEQANSFREMYISNNAKLTDFQTQIDHLSLSLIENENEIVILTESLKNSRDAVVDFQSKLQEKVIELEQSEQRVSSLREKLSIAVTKGKGLIVQRDTLKQSLAETSKDLDKCKQDLLLKEARINELNTKLKAYMEAGERMEALESELSYIRNSATALRESFLLKDSALQRVEEIVEDLELPENFHSGDIIEKVEWLAKSVSGNSPPLTEFDHRASMAGRSHSDAGLVSMNGLTEETEPNPPSTDDYHKRYEELRNKFYGLAEQNEMLEQSLLERNNLVQRWEEILDRICGPSQLRSMEPEDRIEWLISAVSEAQNHCNFLQEKIHSLETSFALVTTDLEESQRKLSETDTALQSLVAEKEILSRNLEILTQDHDAMSKNASTFRTENDNLQKEVVSLQERLDQKHGCEERIQYFEGEIRRLQVLVKGVLQEPGSDDQVPGCDGFDYFEGLLRKLLEKHVMVSPVEPDKEDAADKQVTGPVNPIQSVDKLRVLDDIEAEVAILQKKLDDALSEMMSLKEERDGYIEKNNSLVRQVEALETTLKELQDQLIQEEQKSASAREKLNVAVRKGKSLVQQRDSMKQLIEETNAEIQHLKSVICEYENKTKDLATLQEMSETLRSENMSLQKCVAQNEQAMQAKEHLLSMILEALGHIDVGLETDTNDPLKKLEEIGNYFNDMRAALVTSQQESSKSKRAAELLLAELNEVQERNDALQEEQAKTCTELSALSRERDVHSAEVMKVRASVDQLQKDLSALDELLGNVLSNDLETLRNLEGCIKSCLESSDAPTLAVQFFRGVPGDVISAKSGNKVSLPEIGSLRGQLHRHLDLLHEGRSRLADVVEIVYSKLASQKESYESMRRDIKRLESVGNEKGSKLLHAHRNFSFLFDACTTSVAEIQKWKAELIEHGFPIGDSEINIDPQITEFTEEILFSSDEGARALRERLLAAVKDLISIQAVAFEVNQKDMRSTILNLQKELQEKDIQRERNCMELVRQIKEAEAVAKNYSQELQHVQARVEDLERELNEMHKEHNLLELRTKDLQDQEAARIELEQKMKSVTDALAAKEQENQALLQALDEEEAQMEDMTNKIEELERVIQQKNLDLDSLEISRGKALKKLSVTVSKFDELHHLSESLLSEVEKLQLQIQDRDGEISFLRQEVTRCTNDALLASQMTNKGSSVEVSELLSWLDAMVSRVQSRDLHMGGVKTDQTDEYKEMLKEQIMSSISELEDLRVTVRNGDMMLQLERAKVEELAHKEQFLESSLREKESQLALLQGDAGEATPKNSEILELEPMINKRAAPGGVAPQVRSLRKSNNEQVAFAIDIDPSNERLEDEDDDKAHGFKSLNTSRIVPRFTRPVTDMVDGLWVSCDRALMRQPALRLGVIMYWALVHALLATFVV